MMIYDAKGRRDVGPARGKGRGLTHADSARKKMALAGKLEKIDSKNMSKTATEQYFRAWRRNLRARSKRGI